jgi:hypothetical protein
MNNIPGNLRSSQKEETTSVYTLYTHVHVCVFIHVHVHLGGGSREKEREREKENGGQYQMEGTIQILPWRRI